MFCFIRAQRGAPGPPLFNPPQDSLKTHAMSQKKPPKGKDKKPGTGDKEQPTTEEKIDPAQECLIQCAEEGRVFPDQDDEFVKMFNEAFEELFLPKNGIDLEEWGKDGSHRMH
jgi:hypothetical protein